jgi:hypothetical protein
MEREFGEFLPDFKELGISEAEEDKAIENPTVTVQQQQKKAKKASDHQVQKGPVFMKATKAVWNSATQQLKKKKDIFVK